MTETTLDVLLTPADFGALEARDIEDSVCVVLDVLRATSSMVTALASGATGIMPVAEISEALSLRRQYPNILLAGEREGLRISAALTGGIAFDLGNSPREFTPPMVRGRTIAMTTTNGTRALRACSRAWATFIAAFLNLGATAEFLQREPPRHLLVVCSGTYDQAAYEDVLAAGALCDLLWPLYSGGSISDATEMCHRLFLLEQADLNGAMARSRNARRLLANGELAEDVAFCLQRDRYGIVADLNPEGLIRARG